MRLLRIDPSARATSVTRQLTARAAEEWKKNHPDGDVITVILRQHNFRRVPMTGA